MSMSTPINQIRSRLSAGGQQQQQQPMMYDPNLPSLPDPQQLGTTFPQQHQQQQLSQMTPPQMPSTDNVGMLDDILREMERSNGSDMVGPDPNVGLMNYAINPVNIPPPMSQHAKQQLQSETTQAATPLVMMDEQLNANLGIDGSNITNSSTLLGELSGGVLGQKIINSIKPLVFVFLVVLLLSLHQTNRFLFSFFPQLLLENGQLSIYAILLRCTLAVALFYILGLVF